MTSECVGCGSAKQVEHQGYIVCRDCGVVNNKIYVSRIPIKSKNGKQITQNSVGKTLDFVGSLGSKIGYNQSLYHETNKLTPKKIRKFQRLAKHYQNRIRLEDNATHLRTMLIFNRICSQLGVQHSLKQQTLHMYWKMIKQEADLRPTNSPKVITNHVLLVALCLLITVRQNKNNSSLRFKEIINAFASAGHRVTNKNILKLAHDLKVEYGIKVRKPNDYLNRIVDAIIWDPAIDTKLRQRRIDKNRYGMALLEISIKFLSLLTWQEIGGVQPFPFAVSLVYASDRMLWHTNTRRPILTQKLTAQAVKSAEYTIRDHMYRFLKDLLEKYSDEMFSFIESKYTELLLTNQYFLTLKS